METTKKTSTFRSILFFLAGIAITLLIVVGIQQLGKQSNQEEGNEPTMVVEIQEATQTPTQQQEAGAPATEISPTPIFKPVDIQSEVDEDMNEVGVLAFSVMDGLHKHIFIYHPQFFPLTRLTNSQWDDAYPSFSHDGTKLAYASNQNGNWDIYILDLTTYTLTNVTNTNDYESHPSWSPDDEWLVYESDRTGNFDLYLQSVSNLNEAPIQLTLSEADEYQPEWSPNGRLIAFTSLENGNEDIWVADLDRVEDRYTNISDQTETIDLNPFWSPVDEAVLWSSNQSLEQTILRNSEQPGEVAPEIAIGSIAEFHPQGNEIAIVYHTNFGSSVGILNYDSGTMRFPFQDMPGRINGISWGNHNIDLLLPLLNQSAESVSPAAWEYVQDSSDNIPASRNGLVELTGVEAAFPYLHDEVDESFSQLHQATSQMLGWDFLKTLNNAYVPITQPAPPMIEDYWLYSGRAFEIDDAPTTANWLVTIREDINGKSYWRIYLRPIDQSGMIGERLHQRAWSFALRTEGNPEAYEQGGAYTQNIPDGYWIDFTELANQFGWGRVPALLNWRTYYPGTQHTIFVQKEFYDLETALLQLYPPEALLPPATDSLVPIRPTATPEETDE